MRLTELNRIVCIELAGTQCGEPCRRRWRCCLMLFQSCPIQWKSFYICCYPNETTMVMNCDADAMNVGYSYVQRYHTQFHILSVT